MRTRIGIAVILGALSVGAYSQAWVKPYEAGLRFAKAANWAAAKASFQEAIKARSEDTNQASTVGSSIADRKPWRSGAPYTPNFAVAYSNFKLASETQSAEERKAFLTEAISGFSALVAKGQTSLETMLFLAASYAANNDLKQAGAIQEQINAMDASKAFKVDREVLDQADLRILQGQSIPQGTVGDPRPGANPGSLPTLGVGTRFGLVPPIETKYALLIGNSQGGGHSYAENDVDLMKDALTKHAGYPEANVVSIKNGTGAEIMQQAQALAERMPDSATLFVFYTGAGAVDANGTDYLAGADSPDSTSFDKMIKKLDLYKVFLPKGTTVFAFYEVDRPVARDGTHFGSEVSQVGRIAQAQGCSPGENANGLMVNGKSQGVYAYAMSQVLAETRNNRIPLLEFCWNTFYRVRKGSSETGGGAQTPTLPVVVTMANNVRF